MPQPDVEPLGQLHAIATVYMLLLTASLILHHLLSSVFFVKENTCANLHE